MYLLPVALAIPLTKTATTRSPELDVDLDPESDLNLDFEPEPTRNQRGASPPRDDSGLKAPLTARAGKGWKHVSSCIIDA